MPKQRFLHFSSLALLSRAQCAAHALSPPPAYSLQCAVSPSLVFTIALSVALRPSLMSFRSLALSASRLYASFSLPFSLYLFTLSFSTARVGAILVRIENC